MNKWRLFVANLNYQVEDRELYEFLNRYANINAVKITRHVDGGSRGFAFVDAASEEDVGLLLELNGVPLRERPIGVERRAAKKTKRQIH